MEYYSGTVKNNIFYNAALCEYWFNYTTVFHFGHLGYKPPGWGEDPCYGCYVDNDGETVYWWDIDNYTTQGEHYFAFMWVCFSGNGNDLAEAWCQDLDEDGDHCYLGFWKASPTLESLSHTYGVCISKV